MDFMNICRVCLAEKLEFFDIFSEIENSNYSFRDILQEISQLEVDVDDSLSKNICSTCKDSCHEYVKFRDLIISSNEYQQIALKDENKVELEETVVIEQIVDDDLQLIEEKPVAVDCFEFLPDASVSEDQFIFSDELEEDLECAEIVTAVSSEESDGALYGEPEADDQSNFICAKCNKSFTKKSKLEEHFKSHSSKTRLHSCKICKRKFTTDVLLTQHEIVHSDLITLIKEEERTRCIICSSIYHEQPALEDHMREHKVKMETEVIDCMYCGKSYNKLNNLIRHLKTHDENKTHLCNICNKSFAMGQDLIDHLNRHKGFSPHICHICNKSYMQISKLKNHLRTHSNDKEFLCTECGKKFNRNSNLQQHLLRHTGVKRFRCGQCPAKFVSKGNLKAHMSTHNAKKPYACLTCGSSFTQSYSLVKHNRIHSGERPFQCEFCDMRFYSSDHLKRHIRTHTGEKPYKCDFCSKSFAQNGDLNKHKRLHIGENTYKCTEVGCLQSFRLQSELRSHMKVHYCKEETVIEFEEFETK